jgi:hypothetical protein
MPRAIDQSGVRLQHRAAHLWAHADWIAIEGNERLVNSFARIKRANERKRGGVSAIGSWGRQSLTFGPTLHKDPAVGNSDELVKGAGRAQRRMQLGSATKLFGERRSVEQLSGCMSCAGAGSRICREELSRRDGLAMSNNKVAH